MSCVIGPGSWPWPLMFDLDLDLDFWPWPLTLTFDQWPLTFDPKLRFTVHGNSRFRVENVKNATFCRFFASRMLIFTLSFAVSSQIWPGAMSPWIGAPNSSSLWLKIHVFGVNALKFVINHNVPRYRPRFLTLTFEVRPWYWPWTLTLTFDLDLWPLNFDLWPKTQVCRAWKFAFSFWKRQKCDFLPIFRLSKVYLYLELCS